MRSILTNDTHEAINAEAVPLKRALHTILAEFDGKDYRFIREELIKPLNRAFVVLHNRSIDLLTGKHMTQAEKDPLDVFKSVRKRLDTLKEGMTPAQLVEHEKKVAAYRVTLSKQIDEYQEEQNGST